MESRNELTTEELQALITARQKQYTKQFTIQGFKDNLVFFLDYLGYKTTADAEKTLLSEENLKSYETSKKKELSLQKETINQIPTDDVSKKNYIDKTYSESKIDSLNSTGMIEGLYKTTLSYIGITTNQKKAEICLLIMLDTIRNCAEKKGDNDAITISKSLYQLSQIYQLLPKRSNYSVANFFYEPPRVRTALDKLFKHYNIDPEDKKLEEQCSTIFKAFH